MIGGFIVQTRHIILVSILFLTLPVLFAFQNEPDGFRGIKWGTNIKDCKDMKFISTTEMSGMPVKMYIRKGEKNSIGKAEIQNIAYSFYQDKFFFVTIMYKGKENHAQLKYAFEGKFGKPTNPGILGNDLIWTGTTTRIQFEWKEFVEDGFVVFGSVPLFMQLQNDAKKDAAKQAADDF